MARLLANENIPADVVTALKSDGHDVAWMRDVGPGSPDDRATLGVFMLRPRLHSSDSLVPFAQVVLAQDQTWEGHFAVAQEGHLRLVPFR